MYLQIHKYVPLISLTTALLYTVAQSNDGDLPPDPQAYSGPASTRNGEPVVTGVATPIPARYPATTLIK